MAAGFEEKLRHHKPVRLYAELEEIPSVSPAALFEDLRLRCGTSATSSASRSSSTAT